MTRNFIHLIAFFILFSAVPFHQVSGQVNIGIRAGLATTDIEPSEIVVTDREEIDQLILRLKQVNYGIHIGLMFRFQINSFFIQPEVLYNSHSVEYEMEELLGPEFVDLVLTERFQNLDIPLLVGLKLGFFRINAGPVGHIQLSSASDLLDFSDDYKQRFKDMTLGYQAGIGFDIWNIHLDFRYEGNFTKYGNHIVFYGNRYDFSDTPNRFIGSIGFVF